MSGHMPLITTEVRLHNRRIKSATFSEEPLRGDVLLQFCRVTDRDGRHTLEQERMITVQDDGRRIVTLRLSAEGAAAVIKVLSKMLQEMARGKENPRQFVVDWRPKP